MMALPPVRIQHNLKLVGHSDLGGAPNAGEGMAMKITPGGRRLLYLAHENPPMAMSGDDPRAHYAQAIGQKGRILTTTPPATRNGMRSQFGQMRSEMELEGLRKQCGTRRAQARYLKR